MRDNDRRLGRRIAAGLAAAVTVVALGGLVYLRAWPPIVVVMSSSMEPTIDTGSIVVLKHLDGVPEVGDVVTVPVPAEVQADGYPSEVLHRVIEITEDGLVRTQGDNLDKPDPFAVPVSAVTERVVAVVPGASQLVAFLFSPYGLMWMAAGVFLLVVMPFFDGQRELKLAISEYGYHLRSHTQILQSMSLASQDLAATTERFRESVVTDTEDGFSGEVEPDRVDIPDWVAPSTERFPESAVPDTVADSPDQIDIPDWVATSVEPFGVGPVTDAPDGYPDEVDWPNWVA